MQFFIKLFSLHPFDRENKPKAESASVQHRAVCLDQVFNGDNKGPPFKLKPNSAKKSFGFH